MIRRRDKLTISKYVEEFTITPSSINRSTYNTQVIAMRELIGGCWSVRSCLGCVDRTQLLAEMESMPRAVDPGRCVVPESFDTDFYYGKLSLGCTGSCPDVSIHLADFITLLRECIPVGYYYTAVVRMYRYVRRLEVDESREAVEEKNLVEIQVHTEVTEKPISRIGLRKVGIVGLDKDVRGMGEDILRLLRDRARAAGKARSLNITEIGRSEVVLVREASPALFHELSHLLSADHGRGLLGRKLIVSSDDIRISDGPGDVRKPSARFFDDEGVATKKRWLVEGGVVVDLHHNIRTAYEMGSYPGSTHDPFIEFSPFHTSLLVEGRGWKDIELVEEAKRGFLIDGVTMSSLENGYIRIVPQVAFRLERGELGEPVYIKAIRIPLAKPIKMLAMGRAGYTKYSKGPGDSIVTETSPSIKIEAYIEL